MANELDPDARPSGEYGEEPVLPMRPTAIVGVVVPDTKGEEPVLPQRPTGSAAPIENRS